MNSKVLLLIGFVTFTLGYTVYQSLKIEDKLTDSNDYFSKNSIIRKIPKVSFDIYKSDQKLNLLDLTAQNKKVFVHFWATWCGPCEKEFPELVELLKKMADNSQITFVLVNVNDVPVKVEKFLEKYLPEPPRNTVLVTDNGSLFQDHFGTYKMPETFFFDQKGELLRRFLGPQPWMDDKYLNYLQHARL